MYKRQALLRSIWTCQPADFEQARQEAIAKVDELLPPFAAILSATYRAQFEQFSKDRSAYVALVPALGQALSLIHI